MRLCKLSSKNTITANYSGYVHRAAEVMVDLGSANAIKSSAVRSQRSDTNRALILGFCHLRLSVRLSAGSGEPHRMFRVVVLRQVWAGFSVWVSFKVLA